MPDFMDDRRFLVDAELHDLPFPIRAVSRDHPDGQQTIANISIQARIMDEFDVRWIDRFIQTVHLHRDRMGTESLRTDIADYLTALRASMVRLTLAYPFFIEQVTPVSEERCLVRYPCSYTAELLAVDKQPQITFEIQIPVISTYPGSRPDLPGGLFGQSSLVNISLRSHRDVYPEELVELANRHALSPVYSFLTDEDQAYVIQAVHSRAHTSLVMMDEIRAELEKMPAVEWFSVRSSNYGILHPYSTAIGTEKSRWIPSARFEEEL